MSGDHPIIAALRDRRKHLGWSKAKVHRGIGMSRSTFDKREDAGRFGAIEQLERWAGFLGYKLTLTKVDSEPIYWS